MKMLNILTTVTFLMLFTARPCTAQCIDDTHGPFAEDSWLSCQVSPNPNSAYGESHWIQYDLGFNYILDTLSIWNYNVWGATDSGVREIYVDVSTDNIHWESLGPFTVAQAAGSWKYNDPTHIDLEGISGRYVLFTVDQSWNNDLSCAGLSEIKIGVSRPTSNDNIDELGISIYPNPATDFILLEYAQDSAIEGIKIVNSLGQIAISLPVTGTSFDSKIDISALAPGSYFIMIRTKDDWNSYAFIKAKP